MAVPIPVTWNTNSPLHTAATGGFRLEYPGKKPESAILAATPGQYKPRPEHSRGKNRLYHSDNLSALAALLRDDSVSGQIKLVYIDPPFATAARFESRDQTYAYDDTLVGPDFVESLRERLILINRLLARDGSLYLHLDSRMVFHFRVILDEIFGEKNFRNCITREKTNPKNYTRKTYGNISDYVLFYTKSSAYIWNRPVEPWGGDKSLKEYPNVDPDGRRYKKVPIHAPGRRNGETGQQWRGTYPPPGKHWQYPPRTLDEMDERGEIYWSPTGNPRRKIYLENSSGIPIQDIWMDVHDARNQNVRITGYPTEKSPALLSRIIAASSNPGDLVMDCYSGSGTTLVTAENLGRRWIGIDNSEAAIQTTLRRFEHGSHRMGDFVNGAVQGHFHDPITDFTLYEPVSGIHS